MYIKACANFREKLAKKQEFLGLISFVVESFLYKQLELKHPKMFVQQLSLCLLFSTFVLLVNSVPVTEDIPETVDSQGEHWFGPVRRCPRGDDMTVDVCLEKIVRDLTPLVGNGIKELGLEPLDPIHIDQFTYENKLGPIKLKLLAKEVEVQDLPRYSNLTFRFDHRHSIMHFVYDAKKLRIDTNYKINGMAFGIIPLRLSGPIHLDLMGIKAEGNMHLYKSFNDNKEVVMQLKDAQIDTLTIDEFKVCRLFERHPILNAIAQTSFHRYGPAVFNVMEPEVAKFVGNIISDRLLNPILQKLPYMADFI